jgi:hypothetical protein
MAERFHRPLLLILLQGLAASAAAQKIPTVMCIQGDKAVDCSNRPKRPKSTTVVQVVAREHWSCTVDGQEVACLEAGRHIRSLHPSDDPKVKFCGAPNLDPSELSVVLGSISGEQLPLEFGCARESP